MRTCVIGGSGFIGRYLVAALLSTGREVLVLGRQSKRPQHLHGAAHYISCDYGEKSGLRRAISDCDEVIDLAYATVPQASFANPIFDLQANLAPSVSLMEEARDHGSLRRLVIISSGGTVYGPVDRLPIIEGDGTSPISPYGITKLTIEHYALMFHRLADLPVTIVRPANAYGVGQKPFTGQGFIATAMGHILRREQIPIFGESGTIRDYIHVRDVAYGILRATEHGKSGEIYNLGSGVGRSNRDVLKTIEPLAKRDGFDISIHCVKPRGFDVPANVLSSCKLMNDANWLPQVSFEDGIREMWDGMLSMPNLVGN
jgi:UDP-glucose 4-epimerase